jgi:hypothetical protein
MEVLQNNALVVGIIAVIIVVCTQYYLLFAMPHLTLVDYRNKIFGNPVQNKIKKDKENKINTTIETFQTNIKEKRTLTKEEANLLFQFTYEFNIDNEANFFSLNDITTLKSLPDGPMYTTEYGDLTFYEMKHEQKIILRDLVVEILHNGLIDKDSRYITKYGEMTALEYFVIYTHYYSAEFLKGYDSLYITETVDKNRLLFSIIEDKESSVRVDKKNLLLFINEGKKVCDKSTECPVNLRASSDWEWDIEALVDMGASVLVKNEKGETFAKDITTITEQEIAKTEKDLAKNKDYLPMDEETFKSKALEGEVFYEKETRQDIINQEELKLKSDKEFLVFINEHSKQ